MSEAGLGPKLIYGCSDYRIESFFEGRPLTIWELRNPVVMEETVKSLFAMHNNQRLIDSIEEIIPKQPSRLGIDVAIEEWGPAVITKIAKIRSKLNPESAGADTIFNTLKKLETTYLKPGY